MLSLQICFIQILFVGLLCGFIHRTADRKQLTCSKGPHAGTQTQGHYSEVKASVHETPALPTELNSTLLYKLILIF